jgi:iron complex outermembrane receptor protein
LWGANAVNGVINIISKKAKDTQSALVTAGAGSEERGSGGVRYGNKIGDNTYYRAYGKYFDWGPSLYPSGMTAHDGWDALRGGFRADWTPAGPNSLTLQGDIYRSSYGETLTVPSLNAPIQARSPTMETTAGETFWAGGITARKVLRCRCRCITTTPR